MTGRPNVCLMSRSRADGLLAVQLQHIRPQRLDDIVERRIIGIDRERDLDGAALDLLAEFARNLETEMARRRRKEHEPTMSAPASSATSSVSRVDRPQILTIRDMVSERVFRPRIGRNRGSVRAAFYNVAPCLSRPAAP